MLCSAYFTKHSVWNFSDTTSVRSTWSRPHNICFCIYIVTDWVRLNVGLKIEFTEYLNLNLNKPITTLKCSNEITIIIKTNGQRNFWHNAASPQQTDSPWGHMGATWWIRLNLSFSPLESTTQTANRLIDLFSHFCTAHSRVSSGTLAPPGEHDWTCVSFGCIPLFRQPLFRQPLFRQPLFRHPRFRQLGLISVLSDHGC